MAYLLSQLLRRNAQRTPEQIAVVHEQHSYTYHELDIASNRFAHQLRASGVIRGDRVGLYLEKSREAVAALFGILKVGAAYVPLDPAAPAQRIGYIIANCQMKALVSTRAKATGNPKGVMISHRAALTFVDWAGETFGVQATDRVSNHAPFHFDLSTFDLFATIKAGGPVVLVPPALSAFPLNLAKFIAEQRITIH
jgi:non-ribosomal peptide synthetase component F